MKRGKLWWSALAMLLIALALAVWSFIIEPRRLVVREVTLMLPDWPSANDGLRIGVLSDLHVGSPHHGLPRLRSIVQRVNQLKPDVILLLGDFVIQGVAGGRFVTPEKIAAELQLLAAGGGVFGVLGNHDWWLDAPRVRAALERRRIPVLEDSAVRVVASGKRFWLAGISDYWEGRHDVARTLLSLTTNEAVIAFTHNPDVFPKVPPRVSLTIAGHTHGGQVKLPLLGRPIVPSLFGQRYAYGHVTEGGRHLYVSSGTGTSILPVRFRVPPEIVILTLRSSLRNAEPSTRAEK